MKAVIFEKHGSVDELKIKQINDPVCGPSDVIIKVGAASLNGFDPMILQGTTNLKVALPMTPCGDFAGEIVEIGAKVRRWSVGDRVCPHPFVLGEGMTGETRIGAASQLVRMPQGNLIATPDGVSDIEAAALPIAYGTAYRMIITRAQIKKGEKVLILGASGGVGTCCIQLAKAAGAEVIAAARGGWKLEKLKELGADHVIDTSKENFVEAIHELYGKPKMYGGGGVNVIINYIGGESWAQSLKCLTRQGRMVTCGATADFHPPTDIRYIWTYEQSIMGSNGWGPKEQKEILKMVAEGTLKPVIHAVRELEDAALSIQELIDRKVVGKSILLPNGK